MPDACPRARLRWADVAKGGCILLVVLHHVVTKHVPLSLPDGPIPDAWLWLSMALKPVRMPLFFVVSGLFAARAIHRPWPTVRRRAVGPYYLYAVWLVLLTGLLSLDRTLPMNRTQDLGELVLDLILPSTGLWFLHALAAYFVLTRWLTRFPRHHALAGAAAFGLAAAALPIDEVNRSAVLVHYVFFAAGALYPERVTSWAEQPRPRRLSDLAAAYVVALLVAQGAGVSGSLQVLVLGPLGAAWGLAVASTLARRERTGATLAWLGRRTLPVYVLHVPALVVVHRGASEWGLVPKGPWGQVGEPLLVAGVVTVVCVVAHRLLLTAGLTWLFRYPSRTSVSDLDGTGPAEGVRPSRRVGGPDVGDGGVEVLEPR